MQFMWAERIIVKESPFTLSRLEAVKLSLRFWNTWKNSQICRCAFNSNMQHGSCCLFSISPCFIFGKDLPFPPKADFLWILLLWIFESDSINVCYNILWRHLLGSPSDWLIGLTNWSQMCSHSGNKSPASQTEEWAVILHYEMLLRHRWAQHNLSRAQMCSREVAGASSVYCGQ